MEIPKDIDGIYELVYHDIGRSGLTPIELQAAARRYEEEAHIMFAQQEPGVGENLEVMATQLRRGADFLISHAA